jgi:nitronate monooxygenase
MAGGPSTPALAAAVSGAGGLGFLAAGYKSPGAIRADVQELRSLLAADLPFGVNLFAPPGPESSAEAVAAYARTLAGEAARAGAELGTPRWDDDRYADKLGLLRSEEVPVVSFTFGCPTRDDVDSLHQANVAAWVTVTTPAEARTAREAGADALIVQGAEAGGHRGSFSDAAPGDIGLLALLQLVRAAAGDDLPLVGAGGVMTGPGIAAVLAAGAMAAGLGTAFMLCPEAGTTPAHRDAIERGDSPTALTRAFTGRTARGIANRFLREHSADAPSAYPEIHHLTAPVRTAARQRGDADGFHLWAGEGYPLATAVPAAELVNRLTEHARAALADASERLSRFQ